MKKVKILHAADIHLDPTFRMLGPREFERRKDFLIAFHQVIKFASEHRPDIILISGDLFDKVNPRNPIRVHVIRAFRYLHNMGIKTFLIGGNHDTPRSVEEGASPLHEIDASGYATFFSSVGEMEADHVKTNELDICISGVSFNHTLTEDTDPLDHLKIPLEGDVNIAMLHYNLASFTVLPIWRAPTIKETNIPRDLHYLALGHLHGYKHKYIGNTLAVYPGSTERRTFIEEDDEKGFVWIEINENGIQTMKFINIKVRPVKTLKIHLRENDTDPLKKILDIITSTVKSDKNLILRLIITGNLPLNILTKYRREEIIRELQNDFFYVVINDRKLEYIPEDVNLPSMEYSPLTLYKSYIEKLLEETKVEREREVLRKALEYGTRALEEAGAW